jgi:hemin uptake protein HemP
MELENRPFRTDLTGKHCRQSVGSRTAAASVQPLRRWSTAELLGNDGQVEIDHAGVLYRLRVTSLGKLILTK